MVNALVPCACVIYLNRQRICIDNFLKLLFILPFRTRIFCMSYVTHYVESSQILREKEVCVIFQSNNVGSPITFFVSFSCFLSVQFYNRMDIVDNKVLGIEVIRNSFIRASLLIHTLL